MLRIYISLVLLHLLFGCGQTSNGTVTISEKMNEHLGISPYIPETDYEIGAVILEYHPGFEDQEPHKARVSYFESLKEMEPIVDKELIELWQENNGSELIYGDLYAEPWVISIEIYPGGAGELMDSQIIEVAGHEIQYQFLEKGNGRETDIVIMLIDFEDVGYQIYYLFQSDDIEEAAKELVEDINNNNV